MLRNIFAKLRFCFVALKYGEKIKENALQSDEPSFDYGTTGRTGSQASIREKIQGTDGSRREETVRQSNYYLALFSFSNQIFRLEAQATHHEDCQLILSELIRSNPSRRKM